MKGDFTRDTFDPRKHYSGVRMQQGRVQLDADWNEQVDIAEYHAETTALDTLGPAGGPVGEAGFQIGIGAGANPPGDLTISPGRYYVDGMLCENDAATSLTVQPDLPGHTPIGGAGLYVVYLDVWQRHLSYLDDPSIREVALGGPDTATRAKTVWQVKTLPVTDPGVSASCGSTFAEWNGIVAPSSGRLRARARPPAASTDPCIVAASAGFRGLENQLYRVEIHQGGTFPPGTFPPGSPPTFKWSRENGSVAAEWLDQTSRVLKVSSSGRDSVLNFAPGQFIELIDDRRDLAGEPGHLAWIDLVDGQFLTIAGAVDRAQFPRNPRIRRWESPTPGAVAVTRPGTNDGYLPLEAGVEIRFDDGIYKNGDYWLIPARAVNGAIEWPLDGTNQPVALPPRGIVHHYSRLALVRFTAGGGGALAGTVVEDCRRLFPALTDVNGLFYLGGDGQQAVPNPTNLALLVPLSQPLRVGVANGLQNAHLRFTVTRGGGSLQATGASVEVVTDANGIAACAWELDSTTLIQQVEANLIDTAGKTVHLPIRFTASLSRADQVAYNPAACANLAGLVTVQAALDRLCQLVADEPGFRVRRITAANTDLANDSDVSIARLETGITADCSENVDPQSASRPTCFVTVDVPEVSATVPAAGNAIPQILGADVTVSGSSIKWTPIASTQTWLKRQLPAIIGQQPGRRVLAHFTLRGSFIWAKDRPDLLLDGDVFGRPAGTRTDIRFHSGDRRRGGDLDMWFWLTIP